MVWRLVDNSDGYFILGEGEDEMIAECQNLDDAKLIVLAPQLKEALENLISTMDDNRYFTFESVKNAQNILKRI